MLIPLWQLCARPMDGPSRTTRTPPPELRWLRWGTLIPDCKKGAREQRAAQNAMRGCLRRSPPAFLLVGLVVHWLP